MMYGICNLSLVPMRLEPSDSAEQVSQLLFGEHFTVLEKGAKWTKIQHAWDEYIGWISSKQYETISTDLFTALNTKFPIMVGDIAQVVLHKEQGMTYFNKFFKSQS